MKFIGYLKGLSLGYAIGSENSSFEVDHVRDVAYYSEKLAFERGLDLNTALVIAYGHDLGRTKLGVTGKDHARVSARFMSALMTHSEFDSDTKSMIVSAIKKHNVKGKCHDVYAELIKDADALAHQDEGLITDDNPVEAYRVAISNMSELSIEVAPIEAWLEQYEAHRLVFLQNMTDIDLFKEDSRHWVHEQRKNIRKLRSIIWYLRFGASEPHLDTLDKLLKQFFTDLSDARMYQVQIDHLKTMQNPTRELTLEEQGKILEVRLSKALDLIESHLITGHYDALIGSFNQSIHLDTSQFEDSLLNQNKWILAFSAYLNKASKTDSKKISALHKMRILGKNFKYMGNLGLVHFSSQTVEVIIEQLHDHIGALNDLSDIKSMKQWQSIYDPSIIETEIKRHQKLCKKTLFFFKKLNQMLTNKHILLVSKNT